MDYCYSCRRTLNGALVCPGCGAYAPDIAPPASTYEGGTATAAAAWESYGLGPAGHPDTSAGPQPDLHVPGYAAPGEHAYAHPGLVDDGFAPAGGHGHAALGGPAAPEASAPGFAAAEPAEPDDELPGSDTPSVLGPPSLAPTLHRGRAARRRQMARWKKNRRRAAAATAVALFGGGVTVASMQGHSGKNGSTTAAADPQAPTALQTDNTSVSAPSDQAAPTAAPTHVAPQQHHSTARPAPHSTHAGTDSITSIPTTVIPSGHPVTYSGSTRPVPTTTTAPPAPSSTTGTTTADSGSTSGSTATTPPATPTTSAPPATTAPSTPPPQQLCLLIICLG